jgi:hypothetical protein
MKSLIAVLSIALVAAPMYVAAQMPAPPAGSTAASMPVGVLHRDQASTVLPATVFFRGQTAAIQARNSAGIKFTDGKLLLAALIDASGYASSVQEVYQGYLIVERPILFGGKRLIPGAYGFGFVGGDQGVVMDLGGNTLLRVSTAHDADMKRPMPLEIVEDTTPHQYRLYLGRTFVILAAGE